MPLISCVHCSNDFYAKPSALKKGNGKFCSLGCHAEAKRTGKEVLCGICAKMMYRQGKDLRRSKSGKYFCSKSCQTSWRNKLYVGKRHRNFTTGESSYRQALERTGMPKQCGVCDTEDARVLAVHHIDKDRSNNNLANLAWLCHNCHFLVHHYEGVREAFMAKSPN